MIVSSSPACSELRDRDRRPGFLQVWFDGSVLPNPGKIGIGVVLLAPDGRSEEKSVQLNTSGCNNEAELHALCAAVEMAAAAGAWRLMVLGDSDVALRYVLGPDATRIVCRARR